MIPQANLGFQTGGPPLSLKKMGWSSTSANLRLGQSTELVVPVGFQGIGNRLITEP